MFILATINHHLKFIISQFPLTQEATNNIKRKINPGILFLIFFNSASSAIVGKDHKMMNMTDKEDDEEEEDLAAKKTK